MSAVNVFIHDCSGKTVKTIWKIISLAERQTDTRLLTTRSDFNNVNEHPLDLNPPKWTSSQAEQLRKATSEGSHQRHLAALQELKASAAAMGETLHATTVYQVRQQSKLKIKNISVSAHPKACGSLKGHGDEGSWCDDTKMELFGHQTRCYPSIHYLVT